MNEWYATEQYVLHRIRCETRGGTGPRLTNQILAQTFRVWRPMWEEMNEEQL